MKKIERDCPAKINLILKILNKRSDGFHELFTLMQAVSLSDHLEITLKETPGIELICSDSQLPAGPENLVVQAANAFLAAIDSQQGLSIGLDKKIPIAAGLGGGSSDAANTVLALNELFGNPLSLNKLHEIAARLGSDINFFLVGGAALCRGRGEQVEPVIHSAEWGVLLANPGEPLSTRDVYQGLDLSSRTRLTDFGDLSKIAITSLKNNDLPQLNNVLANDLEGAAIKKLPELATALDVLEKTGFQKPLISGSGPTLFALSPSLSDIDAKLSELRRYLPKKYSFFVCRMRGRDKLQR